MNIFTYTIPEKDLKGMGYKFQKLYAADYKTYRKEIDAYTIWLWVRGKMIEIKDWHSNTKAVVDFYKANIDSPLFNQISYDGKPKGYIKVQLNPKTGYVQLFDNDTYFGVFKNPDINRAWDEWESKYGNWHNEIILRKSSMNKVLKELNLLGIN